MRRGLTARIDLSAAERNLCRISEAAGGRSAIAVVKADAYGHGSVAISRALLKAGAPALAVAYVSEARELRESGINSQIMVFFDQTEIPEQFDLSLTPVLHSLASAREFSSEAVSRGVTMDVHVKVDTGMGRMGLEDPADISKIAKLPGLNVAGLMSHLSDADLVDMEVSLKQVARFKEAVDAYKTDSPPLLHMANSAAVFACPEAHMDAVRPGISLYGIEPFGDGRTGACDALEPVMSVSTTVLAVRRVGKGSTISYGRTFKAERDTLAAVLAVGYADGYSRALSNKAEVLIGGRRAPVAGRVCMDLTVADVTDLPNVREGDEVVLLGKSGNENITAWELARKAGTIPYEVLTALGKNAERVFA